MNRKKLEAFIRRARRADKHAVKLGGLADGLSVRKFKTRDLLEGASVESEHTTKMDLAVRIAMDHLVEDPDYYEKLAEMESRYNGRSTSGPLFAILSRVDDLPMQWRRRFNVLRRDYGILEAWERLCREMGRTSRLNRGYDDDDDEW